MRNCNSLLPENVSRALIETLQCCVLRDAAVVQGDSWSFTFLSHGSCSCLDRFYIHKWKVSVVSFGQYRLLFRARCVWDEVGGN